jgi:segregation and condensation protein B
MEAEKLRIWLEGALLAAGEPLTLAQLNSLFAEDDQPGHGPIREALALLDAELDGRAVELVEVAGGYRLQIRASLMPVVSRLWAEKPPRYSRALLETLAIIAYRQPITRGEIEEIRGVSLSATILKTLQEREWVKAVGHRDIPGRPELLGTTRPFLDYFGLTGLDDLPTLAEIRDLDNIEPELALGDPDQPQAANDDQQQQQSAQIEDRKTPADTEDGQPHESNDGPEPDAQDVEDERRARADGPEAEAEPEQASGEVGRHAAEAAENDGPEQPEQEPERARRSGN